MPAPKKTKKHEHSTKKAASTASQGSNVKDQTHASSFAAYSLPFELQQVILNVFSIAFPMVNAADNLRNHIQQVKKHLFDRDFSAAFGHPSHLEAYALRWSAARALSYSQIFTHPHRRFILQHPPSILHDQLDGDDRTLPSIEKPSDSSSVSTTRVVCIGGGAGAEVVALAAAHRQLGLQTTLKIVAVDTADWSDPISKLNAALSVPPPLPAYASEAAKARIENRSLLDDPAKVAIDFIHKDVLSWANIGETIRNSSLCTIMFTLNELFSTSLPKTTSFLLRTTELLSKGTHLLVVDSPGSYSEIQLGKPQSTDQDAERLSATKKYPMKWLLDHTLLEVAQGAEGPAWEKIEGEDSLWFRIEQTDRDRLKYPIELENMRYQLHLYRRR